LYLGYGKFKIGWESHHFFPFIESIQRVIQHLISLYQQFRAHGHLDLYYRFSNPLPLTINHLMNRNILRCGI
jgi:hypothetical protein